MVLSVKKPYDKLDHRFKKSKINLKVRKNLSSCLKSTSTDLFRILNDDIHIWGVLLILKMVVMVDTRKIAAIAEREGVSGRSESSYHSYAVKLWKNNYHIYSMY